MSCEGLRVTYAREEDKDALVVTVSLGEEVEQFPITGEELVKAAQYIEVLVMDKLRNSQLIMKAMTRQ